MGVDQDSVTHDKRRSDAWHYFSPCDDGIAKCGQCSGLLSYRNGNTSNLKRHLKKKHAMGDVFLEYIDCAKSKEAHHTEVTEVNTESTQIRIINENVVTDDPLQPSNKEKESSESDIIETVLNKRRTSEVWKYCTEMTNKRAMCNICNKVLSFTCGNTGNLNRHLRIKHSITLTMTKYGVAGEFDNYNENTVNPADTKDKEDSSDFEWEETPEETEEKTENNSYKRKRSEARKYFIPCGENRMQCKTCSRILSITGGTTGNLNRHLRLKHGLHLSANVAGDNISTDQPHKGKKQLSKKGPHEELTESEGEDISEMTDISNKRKRSEAWKYFVQTSDTRAMCTTCNKVLSVTGGTTGNLNRHLRLKHDIKLKKNVVDAVCMKKLEKYHYGSEDNSTDSALENIGTRKRSEVWEHFTIIDNKSAQCDHCSEHLTYTGSSTGNLIRHLRSKHTVENSSGEE